MPRKAMDYSKTIIYKIICNDLNITECYVGHTTNFSKRKYLHKCYCNNQHRSSYNFKVYQTIRTNGGWDNWTMVQVEEYPCQNRNEAGARERYWYELLNANLNKYVPNRSVKESNKAYREANNEKYTEYQKIYMREKRALKKEQQLMLNEDTNINK